MKILKITPQRFVVHHGQIHLETRVDFAGDYPRRRHKIWYSEQDITVQQLVDEVRQRFKADQVDFQPPLFALPTREYHAADYLL